MRNNLANFISRYSNRRLSLPPATTALVSLIGGFGLAIAAGTVLLCLPLASSMEGSAPFLNSLFTATSAACVTGLVVVDSGTYWTGFGQAVIAGLMFLGGLGIMTAGAVLLIAIGRQLTMADRLVLREPMGATTVGDVSRLGRRVLLFAIGVQAIGFLLLFSRFLTVYSPGTAAWQGLFHAISAFNNAGFVILPNSTSLDSFQRDHYMLVVLGVLIVLGGISFAVVADLMRRNRINRWSLDTRLVLIGSASLWLIGGLAFWAFETSNSYTLDSLPILHQAGNSFFQVVSGRTAGFSSVDFGETRAATNFLYTILMFIGGASASTAGGVKVNTVMVLLVAGWAALRGRTHPEVFRRELPYVQVARAMVVVVIALAIVFAGILCLALTENSQINSGTFDFQDVLFEVVSAFGTNGLSTGITAQLTDPGKYLLTLIMYVGRLGPLTIALGLALRERRAIYRYAEERVRIG